MSERLWFYMFQATLMLLFFAVYSLVMTLIHPHEWSIPPLILVGSQKTYWSFQVMKRISGRGGGIAAGWISTVETDVTYL